MYVPLKKTYCPYNSTVPLVYHHMTKFDTNKEIESIRRSDEEVKLMILCK